MKETHQCPRCGAIVEGDFCPHCDLQTNQKHGIIRKKAVAPEEQKQSFYDFSKQQAAQRPKTEVFHKQHLDAEEDFNKEKEFQQTIEEALRKQEPVIVRRTRKKASLHAFHSSEAKSTSKECLKVWKKDKAQTVDVEQEKAEREASLKDLTAQKAKTYAAEREKQSQLQQQAQKEKEEAQRLEEAKAASKERTKAVSEKSSTLNEVTLQQQKEESKKEKPAKVKEKNIVSASSSMPTTATIAPQKKASLAKPAAQMSLGDRLFGPKEEEVSSATSQAEAKPKPKKEEKAKESGFPKKAATPRQTAPKVEQPVAKAPSAEKAEEKVQATLAQTQKKQKKRWLVLALLVALLCALGGGYIWWQHQKQQANAQVQQVEKEIAQFYVKADPKAGFVAKKVDPESLQPLKDQIAHLEKAHASEAKQLSEQVETLQNHAELTVKVNALFVEPKIKDGQVEKVALKENAKVELVPVKEASSPFDKAVNESIEDAQTQAGQQKAAKKAVAACFKGKEVDPTVSEKTYEAAKATVKKVQNQSLQKQLTTQLKDVATVREKIEAKEKKEKEAAAKKKAEYEKNHPKSGPYAWAPGVEKKVISTCIERGYIVSGGYSLEKAYVRNGQGYYKLYGTSNHSKTLSMYPNKKLHVYLVTINCKTGWFKGNGGDR